MNALWLLGYALFALGVLAYFEDLSKPKGPKR